MFIDPILSNPLTDILFILSPKHRHNPHDFTCVKIESKFLDCLDAYGTLRAREKCAELMYDMNECSTKIAQFQRSVAMMEERMKQYREGKLSKPFEEYPYLDAFLSI